jgi:hypothetical protein
LSSKPRTSDVLSTLATQPSERLTVGDLLSVLRGRAFALLIVILGLPNCLPMPPPIPLVCGLLLALVAAQIAAGLSAPWLPRALLRRSIPRDDMSRAVARALPTLRRLERWSRPRVMVLHSAVAMRVVGFVLLTLALGLIVAAPIVGQIPLGLAVCLLGLGLVERDGLVVIAGLVVGAVGIALNVGFVFAVIAALVSIFE